MASLIELREVTKTYGTAVKTQALATTSLTIGRGELVVILGPSGSGKSTLLNLIGALDSASTGHIFAEGMDISAAGGKGLARYRKEQVGFVFQFYNLIPSLTAYENVDLAAQLSGTRDRVQAVLADVGLAEVVNSFPNQLSGGQQQRVAIARALVKDPPLLLCDEPTGALDFETGKAILVLLERLVQEHQKTVVIVTHNSVLAAMATRLIRLKDGAVIADEYQTPACSASDLNW